MGENNMEIEHIIKSQYSKIFTNEDWQTFKRMADFYFETAAKILKKDIKIDEKFKLMGRNIQKRLFIGIGTELLIKALFLKNDYCINKIQKGKKETGKPTKFSNIIESDLDSSNTYSLNALIDNITNVMTPRNKKELLDGLKIAKVFRNKEGHVAVLWHKFDSKNYSDIENSIIEIYKIGFDEVLDFQISFEDGEKAEFSINQK